MAAHGMARKCWRVLTDIISGAQRLLMAKPICAAGENMNLPKCQEMKKAGEKPPRTRRDFLADVARGILLAGLACLGAAALARPKCSPRGGAACRGCPDLSKCKLPYSWLARRVSDRHISRLLRQWLRAPVVIAS